MRVLDLDDSELQVRLLQITCLQLASKFEEVQAITVPEVAETLANIGVCIQQLRQAEVDVLNTLDFDLSRTTPHTFLRLYSLAAIYRLDVHDSEGVLTVIEWQAAYILQLACLNKELSRERPSKVAASAVLLARAVVLYEHDGRIDPWDDVMEYYTRYQYIELLEVVEQLHSLLLHTWRAANQ